MPPRRIPMRVWIWTVSVGLFAGCVPLESPVPRGKSVREVYEETDGAGSKLRIEKDASPGSPERIRPVIYPPKVFALWVAEHLDLERDMKIGAHWVYVKLRDSSWTEEPIDREPEGAGVVTPEERERLKRLAGGSRFAKMILPYRSAASDPPGTDLERKKPAKEKDKEERKEFDATSEGDHP